MTDFGQLIHNVSKSAVLTASGWDTPPADLDNAIDGDLDNPTGIAETTLGVPGYAGYVDILMPQVGRYLLAVKLDAVIALYGVYVQLHPKYTGYNIQGNSIFDSANTVLGDPGNTVLTSFFGDSARLAFYAINASKFQVRIYDISIWQLC